MNLVGPGIVVHIFIIYIYINIYTHTLHTYGLLCSFLRWAVGCSESPRRCIGSDGYFRMFETFIGELPTFQQDITPTFQLPCVFNLPG